MKNTKTDFIPIDYDYFDCNGRNYAKIIGRSSKGERICIVDECDVFLWAILRDNVSDKKIKKLIKKISEIQLDTKGRQTKVEKVELKEKNFLGKKVKALKIYATNYKDLHDVADELGMKEIKKRRGYDLGYVSHYIIEKDLTPLKWHEISGKSLDNSKELGGIGMSLDVDKCIKADSIKPVKSKKKTKAQKDFTPKVLAYDIESDELEIGDGEIIMVSLVDNNGFQKVITYKKDNEKISKLPYVEYVEDEAALLEKFVEYVREISPDFLTGYFSDGFDLPYLRARAEKFNVDLALGLDESRPRFSRGRNMSGKIKGIVHLDLIKFIKTAYAQYMKSETLSLDDVAKEFLGEEKNPFEHQHSSKLDYEGWQKYYEYNLQDSKLVIQLFNKFWPDLLEFSKTIQEPVFDVSRAGLSKYVENYILHNLKKFNEIPEKRPTYNDIRERRSSGGVTGAFVYEPTPGLYENLAMFDFTSMHTSIIITHNLSKGTLLKNKKQEKNPIESPELTLKGKKQKFYFSKKQGFFPELMREIFNKRKKFKAQYKKDPNVITRARSNAFKVLSASVHGYVGFFGARYYSLEASASILAFVRKYNKDTIKKIEEKDHKIIYGDTDSISFLIKEKNKKQIKKLLSDLNSELPGIMELELEKIYKRGLWVTTRAGKIGAKKKYALIDKEGKLKIRGFETVRRDWCQLSRNVQDKVLRLVLKDGDEKRALEYVKKIVEKIKNREISIKDLIIKTQLKKSIKDYKSLPPHVVAAKKMKEQEIPVTQGNLVEYYISEPPKGKKARLVREKVKLPGEKGKYNIEYYLKRQILPAVENIFQVFDIKIKEIMKDGKQKTLGDF
ncbi:hypothetical protein GF378_00715 [Candidatus Pacearchaeota archaeon]|nr:hypothetical protein [Candidatus Pacearchaeota archaeon]